MKLENKILVSIIIIGLIIFNILLYKELRKYQDESILSRNPFNEIKILNTSVELNDTNRYYKNNIDCSSLKENEQIISYKLVEGKEEYKVSTNIQILNNDKLVSNNYNKVTSLMTRLTVQDPKKQYEQIYIIESICQQGDLS